MSLDAASLPDDVGVLKAMLIAADAELERVKLQLAKLRRMQFGQSSERLRHQADQLELGLEDIETDRAARVAPVVARAQDRAKPFRQPLPGHLPRDEIVHEATCVCPDCGGQLRRLGQDITEQLEYVPSSFRVVRHLRPRLSCRLCERVVQAPLPSMPIERGRPGPGLLAHVIVSKYVDHLPLYRQSDIYARQNVNLARSTLAEWVGRSARLMAPLVDALEQHVMAGATLHADDTPVPVLSPGAGRTRTGRLWTYVRDERPAGGDTPPAVLFHYAPDRKAERPVAHLRSFSGALHADGYAGFERLYGERISETACWAHVRRKFYDIYAATSSPTAQRTLDYIASLYAVEEEIRGRPPDQRRSTRQARAGPVADELRSWLDAILPKLSRRSELAVATRYALSRWPSLTRYLGNGRLEIDNNPAERAIRAVALGRKNWLFAGSDEGGRRAAALYSLTETAKLNGIDPEAWLRSTLDRIADHPIRRVAELLPWHFQAS